MKTARQLRDLIATEQEKMQADHAKAAAENRDFTQAESTQWDESTAKIAGWKRELAVAEQKEALDAELASTRGTRINNHSTQEAKDLSKFSVLRMVRSVIENKPLDGLEAEMHQEAQKEARTFGENIMGLGIPSRVLASQKRDNSITAGTQPDDGSAVMIKPQYYSMLDMLKNAMVVRQLGATYMDDLTGNMTFTTMTERPVASWNTETGSLTKTNAKWTSEDFAPKRLGTFVVQSKQFLLQTAPSVEQKIRAEIAYSIQEGVDLAALAGTGASNQPTGILSKSGVNTVAIGTNGGAPTRAILIEAETVLADLNVMGRSYGWAINAVTKGKLKNTLLDAGSGKFLMEENNSLIEYPAYMTNMLPKNLTKGTSTGVCSAAIFGDWSELHIGQWGGIDLLVDPYTLAETGQVKIVAQGFFNIHIARANAFVKIVDITTT